MVLFNCSKFQAQGLKARKKIAQGKPDEVRAALGKSSPQIFSLSSSNEERAGVRSRIPSTDGRDALPRVQADRLINRERTQRTHRDLSESLFPLRSVRSLR